MKSRFRRSFKPRPRTITNTIPTATMMGPLERTLSFNVCDLSKARPALEGCRKSYHLPSGDRGC